MTVSFGICAASNYPNVFLKCLDIRMGSTCDLDPEFRPLTPVAECNSLFCYNLSHYERTGLGSLVGSAIGRLLRIASRKPVMRRQER